MAAMRRLALLVIVTLTAACPARSARPTAPLAPGEAVRPGAPTITWKKVETAADLPAAPAPGSYQIHLIDVGTGLALLVRGADFALLYDAGTNDRDERPMRVGAYLAAVLGPSGDDLCVPAGTPAPIGRVPIDHVVLSHPHLDHASALDLVVHCYDVATFWDAGLVNETVFYRELLAAIARSAATRYRTAASVPDDRAQHVKGLAIAMPRWERFSEGDTVPLGAGARFTILHADPKVKGDPNQASVVVAVELGGVRLLLVGDAESGPRKDPSYPPGDVEEFLIAQHAPALRADILQVGHHGSKTSSRRAFLEAVRPRLALISSGPKQYGRGEQAVRLPDREVLEELARLGTTVLRTDERDDACPVVGRIGGDAGPGGCDSWVITIDQAR